MMWLALKSQQENKNLRGGANIDKACAIAHFERW